jgi:hypothetical protein
LPVPVDDEATSIEPAVEFDREPGLGRVTPKRSDVHELLAAFHVTLASDEEQLLSALRRGVESHGTPLPPSVSGASFGTHRR